MSEETFAKELILKDDLDAEYVYNTAFEQYLRDVPNAKLTYAEYHWLRDYINNAVYENEQRFLKNFLKEDKKC